MPAYVPPHLRPPPAQQAGDARALLPSYQGHPPQPPMPAQHAPPSIAESTPSRAPTWRLGAGACPTPYASGAGRESFFAGRPSDRSTPFTTALSISEPAPRVQQTADEISRYRATERFCLSRQPKVLKDEECEPLQDEGLEELTDDQLTKIPHYAQWAGGYVEVNEKLLEAICPCNLVGKPCPFDDLNEGCPMIRLCSQLEKWTVYKCPDKGFRTILDAAKNVPVDYGKEEFGAGAINYFDSGNSNGSEFSESGGVPLDLSNTSKTDSTDENANTTEDNTDATQLQPNYNRKKVSFNDFSCGVKNDCGHIHWEVEINCRFVAWSHYKTIPCKQVLEKDRLCSVGHDLESARQAARDTVRDHERSAARAGAQPARVMGQRWVY